MPYQKDIRILRGSQRFKGSLDKNITIPTSLEQTHRMLIETERNAVLNLNEQYYRERDESTIYRVYGKIKPTVDNVVSGKTSDPPTLGFQTYYYPPTQASVNTEGTGFPSINFFDFFVPSALTSFHNYVEPESYKSNWAVYLSYVSAEKDKSMRYTISADTNIGVKFNASDGIPFSVKLVKINGKDALQCICPVEHGLLEGEYIELQDTNTITTYNSNLITTINGSQIVPIYSFGDEFIGNDKKIFNIILRPSVVGPNTFVDEDMGVFKRLSDPDNYNETLSRYYVHQHKLLTDYDESIVDRAAFEFGIYNKRFRYYREDQSPPFGIGHEVVKNQTSSYLFNFSKDIDVRKLKDNLNRPLQDLYVTILVNNQTRVWQEREITKKVINGQTVSVVTGGYGLGWSWNFPTGQEVLDPYPQEVFSFLNTPTQIPNSDNLFLGAFVEYNEFELKERIISENYHALKFNPDIFHHELGTAGGRAIDEGYYYQPHYRVPIRKQANSISTYPDYRFVPSYATFSIYEQLWRWRNILDIGFFDSGTNGADYPFVNGAHYPFINIDFFIRPWLVNKPFISDGIIEPLDVDDCE